MAIMSHIDAIDRLIDYLQKDRRYVRLLDYGCGRGLQYNKRFIHQVIWKTPCPFLYDIAVKRFNRKPLPNSFDGIICTNVLEYISKNEIKPTLTEIFCYLDMTVSKRFVFFEISCRINLNEYPNATCESPEWWQHHIFSFKTKGTRAIVCYT